MEYIFYNLIVFTGSFLIGLIYVLISEYKRKEKYKYIQGYAIENDNIHLLKKLIIVFIISCIVTAIFFFVSMYLIFESLSIGR